MNDIRQAQPTSWQKPSGPRGSAANDRWLEGAT